MVKPKIGPLAACLLALTALSASTVIPPSSPSAIKHSTDVELIGHNTERQSSGISLRILCLGASITFGQGSTTGNGYRKDLRDLLEQSGNRVHFVGTQNSGNMENNANEGYPGRRIDQVSGLGWNSYGYLPNVICVHLGTNDFVQGYDPQTSANRMGIMIDQIYTAIDASTLVIVSKLLPNRKATTESGIERFNSLLDDIVRARSSQGKNVVLVDMHSEQFSLNDIGPDGTHPTDAGYQKMAGVWFDAINKAIGSGKVPALKPNTLSDTDDSNNNKCEFTPSTIGSPGSVQFGFGNKTAIFKSSFVNKGTVLTDTGSKKESSRAGIHMVRSYANAGAADYVRISPDGTVTISYNTGDEVFSEFQHPADTVPECDLANIRFADISGDTIDDFICINAGPHVDVYFNKASEVKSAWNSSPDMSFSLSAAHVYFGDINGDGRDDVIAVSSAGEVSVIYSGYISKGDISPTPYSTGWTIPDFNATATHFFDVNGDGRVDCVNVAYDGTMTAWLNYRGATPLQPYWQANGIIKHPIGGGITSDSMRFGRIRGTSKTDFATLHKDGTVKVWENYGYLGIAWGEYVRYCDMTASGSDSYMTLGPSGSLKLYQNLHDGGIHLKYGQLLGDQGYNRADIRLADLNGDGKCDYVVLNNATGGAMTVSLNEEVTYNGNTSSSITFSDPSQWTVSNYHPDCDRTGVWFADLNGDGSSDYICVDSSGNVYVGINSGSGFALTASPLFSAQEEMVKAAGVLGRDLMSWADINGDGLADYLFFNPTDGSVSARLNTNKGQAFGDLQKIYSDPSFVGGILQFANLDGLGRADIINVNVLSAKGKSSANRCPPPTPPTGIGPNPNPPEGSGGTNGTNGGGDDGGSDDPQTFYFATVGDSYASGVTYGWNGRTNYDDNKSGCMRIDHAYGVQFKHSFTNTYFQFPACSGSQLVNMVFGDDNDSHSHQMDKAGPGNAMITMHAGGNNAGFFQVARDCLFGQDLNHDYGEPYPGNGDCTNSLQQTNDYINGVDPDDSIYADMVTTLTDIKKHPNFAGVFKFYVLGYAHFFNTDSNFCNRRSIAVNPFSSKFILTPELRTAINDAMTNMNKEIQRAVADMNDATFGYVSITEGFAGHRFCEPGQEKDWPYTTNRAWFWSANVLATASDDPNDPQQQQIDDDFLKAYNNTDSTEAAAYLSKFDWTYLDLTADGLNATSGPDQNGAPGSTLRPMHPTIEGHGAITDILIARVQQDFGADALSN